jgi:hypothetical protein
MIFGKFSNVLFIARNPFGALAYDCRQGSNSVYNFKILTVRVE